MKLCGLVPSLLLAIGSAGCVPKPEDALAGSSGPSEEAPPAKAEGPCDAQRVTSFQGRKLTAEVADSMRQQAGAEVVRTAHKNGAITMDYNANRLNIFYDDEKVIVRVDCG